MRRTPSRRAIALIVVAAALLTGACGARHGWLFRTTSGPRLDVVVIGDSLSTGFATPGNPWTVDARTLLREHGQAVRFLNVAENGAGYVASGADGDTFENEAAKVVNARSQVVVLFGSDNDVGLPGLTDAVRATLVRVRRVAPRATIVVIGPPAPPAQQRAPLVAIDAVLRAASTAVGGRFVDALSLRWFQGSSATDVGPDEEHPNAIGEHYLAQRLTSVLAPTIRALART